MPKERYHNQRSLDSCINGYKQKEGAMGVMHPDDTESSPDDSIPRLFRLVKFIGSIFEFRRSGGYCHDYPVISYDWNEDNDNKIYDIIQGRQLDIAAPLE